MFFRNERSSHFVPEKRTDVCAGRAGKFSKRNASAGGQPEMAPDIDEFSAQIQGGWPTAHSPGDVRCSETIFWVSFERTRARKADYLNKYS